LLNGLYDAKLDNQPVLALTGMHYHDLIGTLAQQDVELDKLFEDVAVFNQRVMGVTHVDHPQRLCRDRYPFVVPITWRLVEQAMLFSSSRLQWQP